MLLCYAAAAVLAYLSLRRLASNRWIALTATLTAFSSAYFLYYSDAISGETAIDLFAVMLVFHGMAVFEQEGRFRQLLPKICLALLLGWHVYALLPPYIPFGLMRDLYKKTRSEVSPPPPPPIMSTKARRTLYAALSLLRSRYLTLGMVALLFGVSVLTFNFTNEYFALNRETPLTELPSFKAMIKRIGIEPSSHSEYLSWPAFPERQFYRIGIMSLPYAFSPSFVEQRIDAPSRLFVILGIAAFGASLIGLLFFRRNNILLSTLTLSGFCWALPMRHNTAYPWHSFYTVFYIGVALTLFSLILLYLLRLSNKRVVAALSVAALLIFVVSVLRMATHLDNPNEIGELHQTVMADSETIRKSTEDGDLIHYIAISTFPENIMMTFAYYLSGRIVSYERTADFVVTGVHIDEIASLTPKNRVAFLYEWNDYHGHIDEIIKQADDLIIRSHFDVYLSGSNLTYVKDDCREDDAVPPFFLALFPVDESALPVERKQHGFDNLDFYFDNQAVQRYGRCIAITPLPDYDIARIYTGQYIQQADGSFEHPWEGEIHLTQ